MPWSLFAIAYGFSWLLWLLPLAQARGWHNWPWVETYKVPLLMAGACGPLLAALTLTWHEGGARAFGRFAARALQFRIPWPQLAVALLLSPILAAAAMYWNSFGSGPPLAWTVPFSALPGLFLMLFFVGGSFQEEFGWALAIDRMQRGRSPLLASVWLGGFWGLWHLPLFFIPYMTQAYMPLWSFIVLCVSLRVILVWVYNAAQRSILATLLAHTSMNLSLNLFPLIRHETGIVQRPWLYFTGMVAVSAIIVAWLGYRSDTPVPVER
jgi:hypothetical protein